MFRKKKCDSCTLSKVRLDHLFRSNTMSHAKSDVYDEVTVNPYKEFTKSIKNSKYAKLYKIRKNHFVYASLESCSNDDSYSKACRQVIFLVYCNF